VVTGIGAYSPLGIGWEETLASLKSLTNRIRVIESWEVYD
jgi:3-oxoacyl-(acyl-carrier-protein) synthase